MSIMPDMSCKPIADCAFGDLLRVSIEGRMTLAFFATRGGPSRMLCYLEYPGHSELPCWNGTHTEALALSYGRNYCIDVDHESCFAGARVSSADNVGCLFLHGSTWWLKLKRLQGYNSFDFLFLNLETGELKEFIEPDRSLVFPAWWLSLTDNHAEKPHQVAFEFNASSRRAAA